MFKDLFEAHVHLGSFLLRVGLAAIFIFHGFLKLAANGGTDWHKDLTEATQLAVTWGELACGFALLLGLLSRIAALGIIVMQVGAIVMETGQLDFIYIEYVLPNPTRIPTGAEYNFALIVMCLAVMAIGSGAVAVDHLLFGRRAQASPSPTNVGS